MKYIFLPLFLVISVSLLLVNKVENAIESESVFVSIPTRNPVVKPVRKAVSKISKIESQIAKSVRKAIPRTKNIVISNEDFSDVENLDFTPNIIVSTPINTGISKVSLIKVTKIENAVRQDKVDVTQSSLVKTNDDEKRFVKEHEYELSYNLLPEAGSIAKGKFETVAWNKIKLDIKIDKKINNKKVIAKSNYSIKEEDRISIEASAPERSNFTKTSLSKPTNDELVFFDYSLEEDFEKESLEKEVAIKEVESKVVNTQKQIERPEVKLETPAVPTSFEEYQIIEPPKPSQEATASSKDSFNTVKSSTLEEAVAKLQKETKNFEKFEKIKSNESNVVASTKNVPVKTEEPIKNNFLESSTFTCDQAQNKSNGYSFEYSVSLKSIGVLKKFEDVRQFEIRFSDDLDEIQRDFGEGKILLKGDLSGSSNIRRGTLYARGHYPTTLDIVFENTEADLYIPTFKLEKMEDITQELGIADNGAHLLVELDESTEDIELGVDHKYNAKVYLDKNYNIVDRGSSEYFYVLFIGVDSGNIIVNFQNNKNQVTTKIVHLTSQEIYYEPNFYADFSNDNVTFFEEGVMTNCQSLLQLNTDQVKPWSFVKDVKKESLNTINFKGGLYPLGSRKYVQLTHLEEPLFVGFWGEEQVAVPSEAYINQVLSRFDIRGGECLIQLNLAKTPTSIKYNGISDNSGMNTELKVLDADGKFYEDPSDQTKRVFIKGENQGIVSVEFTYPDSSKQYLQTFCSDNTFLVEQL